MKRLSLSLFILLTAVFSVYPQRSPSGPELTALLNEFLAGAGRNDAAVHDRFWADDLIYTRSAGVRTNKVDLMKDVRSAPAAKAGDPVTVYTAEEIRIQQYGNAAVVAFKLVGTTTKSDGTKTVTNNLNTGTFINRDGKWQVVAWQSTVVPKPEAATVPQPQTKLADVKPAALPNAGATVSGPLPTAKTASGRTYQKGPRGGCYYLNTSGNKVYVDHSNCK